MVEPKHRRKSVVNRPKRKSMKCSHNKGYNEELRCKSCGKLHPREAKKIRAYKEQKRMNKVKASASKKRTVNKKSNQGGSMRNG